MENLGEIELEHGEYFLELDTKTNTLYVSHNKSDSIFVIDGNARKIIDKIKIENPRQLAFDDNTSILYAISGNAGFRLRDNGAKISIIDTKSNQIINTVGDKEGFGDIKLSLKRNLLYATQTKSKKVWVIDTNTNSVIEKISVGAKYRSIAIDSENNIVYLAGRGGMLPNVAFGALDGSTYKVEKIINKAPWQTKKIWDLFYNPHNNKLYALIEEPSASNQDNLQVYIQVVDIGTKKLEGRKSGRTEQDRIVMDVPKNRLYLSKTMDGEFSVLNESLQEIGLFQYTETGNYLQKKFSGSIWPTKLAVNSNLDLIYIADGKNRLLHIMRDR